MNQTQLMKKQKPSLPEMIYQGEISECGLACACMMLNSLGETITLPQLRDRWNVNNGASLDLLVNIFKSCGYTALPVKFDISNINHLPVPCILHYGGNHYVYVYSRHGAFFQVLNPATGRFMITAEELALSATGYAVILDAALYRQQKTTGRVKKSEGWLDTLSFPGIFRRCLLGIFLALFGLLIPVLFSFISGDEHFFDNEQTDVMFSGMILLFTLIAFLQYSFSKLGLSASINAASRYKPSLFNKLLKKDFSYFERRSSGDINQRISAIGTAIISRERLINDKYKSLIVTLITIAVMMWLNIILTCFSLVTMMIFGLFSYYFTGIKKAYTKSLEESIADMESFNLEAINGIQTIRSGELYTSMLQRYNKSIETMLDKYKKLNSTDIKQNAIFSFLSNIDSILFLWLAFYSITSLNITYGNVVAFWFFRKIALDSVNQFYQCTVAQQLQKVSDERIQDMLSYKEVATTNSTRDILASLSLKAINFGYSDNRNILNNFNITVAVQAKIAITGRSGTGKSTLLKLMAGLYPPQGGCFFIDDIEIEKADLPLFYANIYYLPQQSIIFNGTIFDNIVWYSGGTANEARCRNMLAKFALLDEINKLPAGLQTIISPAKPVLSSGQLQRLMLCRALLSSKPVILLDEPTANLDANNAALAMESLLASDKTIILSTHDSKMLSRFDTVINLDKPDDNAA